MFSPPYLQTNCLSEECHVREDVKCFRCEIHNTDSTATGEACHEIFRNRVRNVVEFGSVTVTARDEGEKFESLKRRKSDPRCRVCSFGSRICAELAERKLFSRNSIDGREGCHECGECRNWSIHAVESHAERGDFGEAGQGKFTQQRIKRVHREYLQQFQVEFECGWFRVGSSLE